MPARLSQLLAVILLLSPVVVADQYWIAYEGNDYPENEGWFRVSADGGAQRSIEGGVLRLDGAESVAINDVYGLPQYPFDPVSGEVFRAEWRCAIDQLVGIRDPGVAFFSDQAWAVAFSWSQDFIRSEFESIDIPFAFTDFHTFSLTSSDMRSYQLIADGLILHQGQFVQVLSRSRASWGDGVEGAASISRWDYVRFGVVPEPAAYMICVVLVSLCCTRRRQ